VELNRFIGIRRASENVFPEQHKRKISVSSDENKQVYLEESKLEI
jgi:hypothetical protein